jgi:cytochrome P450
MSLIPIIFGLSALGFFISHIIYNLYFHALANAPGPFLARISHLPSFYHTCRGNRHLWLLRCFEFYGDKFRATPNTVLFNTSSAYNAIYNAKSNAQRSNFYHIFSRNDSDYNTLTTTNAQAHAQKRRLLKLAFTERSLKSTSTFVERHVDQWNDLWQMKENETWSRAENVSKRLDCLIFDILCDICFGKDFNTKERNDNPVKRIPDLITRYMQFQYRVSLDYATLRSMISNIKQLSRSPLRNLILWLKPHGMNRLMSACAPKHVKDFYGFVQKSVDQRYATFVEMQRSEKHSSFNSMIPREDMFHFLCAAKDPNTGQLAFTKTDLLPEARLLLIAGTDTTSTALSASLFYINNNPRVYQKLTSEIRSKFSSRDQITYGPLLASCEYLRAVIEETMRITPAGPSEAERLVRSGGMIVDGQFYPAGTQLGVPHWPYYHNEDIFIDAWKFNPDRWIESVENPTSNIHAMRRAYSPFSKGANSCIGQNLATMILSITLARTLWTLDCRIAPGTNLGAGHKDLCWGRQDENVYQVEDAFVSLRMGPMLQFQNRIV